MNVNKFNLSEFFLKFWENIWRESSHSANRIKKTFRIFICSYQKFLTDEAFLRASSICYSMVISFVPTLVVVMMVGARFINIEEWFSLAKDFLKDNNIPIDPNPFFEVIHDFLQNSAAIGGVGLLILLFSATNLLRNLEDSLNKIWKINKSRPIIQKISGFVMVMIFSPVLMATGISLTQGVLNKFSVPDFSSISFSKDKVYITGSNATLAELTRESSSISSLSVINKIDFEYDNKKIIFKVRDNNKIPYSGLSNLNLRNQTVFKVDKSMIKKTDFLSFFQEDNKIFIMGTNGILLHSSDGGTSYHVKQFQKIDYSGKVINLKLKQIYMVNKRKGFIFGNDSFLAYTLNGGKNWNMIDLPQLSGLTKR